jgi:dihydrofolate synthase / folylpolyglutamate synthase
VAAIPGYISSVTYREAVAYLESLAPRGWRLGLDRVSEFVRRAGLSDLVAGREGTRFIHVAGTNGKGSVTAFLQSMMVESGWRTGAFFSPYVVDLRERVQLDRTPISRPAFARLATRLRPIAESLSDTEFGGVTEFEFKTALGFEAWRVRRCEWVALEVGLGGRLDATNVVEPAASMIVSIGLDHVGILGDTLGQIAAEKAGILKPGRPAIVGDLPPEALEPTLRRAAELDCQVWRWGREIRVEEMAAGACRVRTPRSEAALDPSLLGPVQFHNAALAYAAMEIAGAGADIDALVRGAASAALPGRFQLIRTQDGTVLLDGAHNRDAAVQLRRAIDRHWKGHPPRMALVLGMTQGHDADPFLLPLRERLVAIHAAPIRFHRGREAEDVAREVGGKAHRRMRDALKAARDDAGADGVVLVSGSFYLVGEALRAMRGTEPRAPRP